MKILSELTKIKITRKKRLGRGLGSGKGAKSGRGFTRHQKSRSKIPLFFEGGQARLVKKYPLLRGKGKNKSKSKATIVIDLDKLNIFKDGTTVDQENLIKQGIVREKNERVKILANGKLSKKLTIKLPVSQAAKNKIEKAGGEIIQ